MRRFSLYKRGRFWYAQLRNPATRKYLPGRSTGESDRRAADEWFRTGILRIAGEPSRRPQDALQLDTVLETIRRGSLTTEDAKRIVCALNDKKLIDTTIVQAGPGTEPLVAFLNRFWNHAESPYVREKLAHGQQIGKRHCYDMALWVRTCWEPYFGKEKRLVDIRKADLKDFSLWLSEDRGLAWKTINNAVAAGSVAFRWAHKNDLLPSNPADGLVRFSGATGKRGVLTEEEVARLFSAPWPEERARVGNALAMCTGLRAGEILALQIRDVGDDRLHVRHSWSNLDGLKGTKTGKDRSVPLLASIRGALLDLARKSPHDIGLGSFVFWSVDRQDRPMDFHFLLDGLKDALLALTLTEEQREDPVKVEKARQYWKARIVVFHSWRHYYAARMADRLESRKVMLATGHSNRAVFESYADHRTEEVFQEVLTTAPETFGRLISFLP